MGKIFKINDKMILNYTEYQKEFDIREVYNNLEDFMLFAKIHLLPLDLFFGKEKASEFSGRFWYKLIEKDKIFDTAPKEFLRKAYREIISIEERDKTKKACEETEERPNFKEELEALSKELLHIQNTAGLNDDITTAAKILAIFKLSGKDVLSYVDISLNKNPIDDFPEDKRHIELSGRGKPYRYRLTPSKKLKNGEVLKTVCVKAVSGESGSNVTMFFYGDNHEFQKDKTLDLSIGEYLYFIVCGGCVYKILPAEVENGTAKMYRKYRGDKEIYIRCGDDPPVLVEESKDCDIISFALYGENEKDYVYIYDDGKIGLSMNLCNELTSELLKKLLSEEKRAVEVLVIDDKLRIILEDGTVKNYTFQNNGG